MTFENDNAVEVCVGERKKEGREPRILISDWKNYPLKRKDFSEIMYRNAYYSVGY